MDPSHRTLAPAPMTRPDTVLFRDDLPREHDFEPLVVDGEVPADLSGTLYRNGPGLFGLFGRRYSHPFEGDGAVTAVRLRDGRAFGATRITRSQGLGRERAAGRMLYGVSAPLRERWRNLGGRSLKNTANTSVIGWSGRVLALMEAAGPTEIEPRDLNTLGATDLDGVVSGAFSAHPHRVASRRALYNFGVQYGREHALNIYEWPEGGAIRRLTSVPLPFPPLLHDFVATDNYLVFLISPAKLRVGRLLASMPPFGRLWKWAPELGTEVIAVPIDAPEKVIRFRTGPFFQWHFANGYEDDDALVIDIVRYDDLASLTGLTQGLAFAPGILHRLRIDLARERVSSRPLYDVSCEFPRVHPVVAGRAHRYVWLVTHKGYGLARVDVRTGAADTYNLPAGQYASEAIFVPAGDGSLDADEGSLRGSDDCDSECRGYALSLLYDVRRHASCLAVFDGHDLSAGPVARAWFDHHIPITFHGDFVHAEPSR